MSKLSGWQLGKGMQNGSINSNKIDVSNEQNYFLLLLWSLGQWF